MKLTTYKFKGIESVGAIVDNEKLIIDLANAEKTLARREKRPCSSYFTDMLTLLEAGSKGRTATRKIVRSVLENLHSSSKLDPRNTHPINKVRLRPPVPNPRKVFALAGNYQDHIEEGGGKMDAQDKETPRVFMKPPTTTVIGMGDRILIPPVARAIDWEGELAVVMGRRAKNVKSKDALKYVAGYTVMNDVSERKLLIKKRTEDRPQDGWFDWLNGKWLDTFAPQGPWIVTTEDIPNPQTVDISTYINGERKQHNNTKQMLYPVADIIQYISTIITLEPGDLISTGTVSGVGNTTGTYLKPGDKVEIEISKIGILRNSVAASKK